MLFQILAVNCLQGTIRWRCVKRTDLLQHDCEMSLGNAGHELKGAQSCSLCPLPPMQGAQNKSQSPPGGYTSVGRIGNVSEIVC